ncbi:MAG: hypothetical protein MJ085_01895 [Clostridia bacterium]|nr:hypothetical protein [Clostridia bacterium]
MQTKNTKSKTHSEGFGKRVRWILTIFFLTVAISALFSFLASTIMEDTKTLVAFIVLLIIILIGIVFDMVGVAVTAADTKPFHSMAAKKKAGAKDALFLLRNADKVASVCNDVIGDICGVISGSASAAIAVSAFTGNNQTLPTLLMSALVAGLTVGGKACGKAFAIRKSTNIVQSAAILIYYLKFGFLKKKKKR